MNVLFVIGNGFDLQLGLPTSYCDFYQYYCKCPSNSKVINKLKDNINTLGDRNWSDLELALGKYTANTQDSSEFITVYDDIQKELQNYLLTVDSLVEQNVLELNATPESFFDGFRNPEKYFMSEISDTINSYIVEQNFNFGPGVLNVKVLSFNYTHTFEHFYNMPIPEELNGGDRYLGKKFHVHRELMNNASIWLGVDNLDQIENESFRQNEDIILRLVKQDIIREIGTSIIEDTDRMISTADLICLFGVSLGDTDATWVKKIGKSISFGVPTLYFVKEQKSFVSDNDRLVSQRRFKNGLVRKLENLGLSIDKDKMRLFVEVNSPIFIDGTENRHDENLKKVLEKLSVVD